MGRLQPAQSLLKPGLSAMTQAASHQLSYPISGLRAQQNQYEANTRCGPNVEPMLAHHRGMWSNVAPSLGQRLTLSCLQVHTT